MATYKFKQLAAEALQRLNPFGAVTMEGALAVMDNENVAYRDVIKALYNFFPKGYIDLVLFSAMYQGELPRDARSKFGRRIYAHIDWGASKRERTEILRKICLMLLRITGATFNEAAFNHAIYINDINNEGKTYEKCIINYI